MTDDYNDGLLLCLCGKRHNKSATILVKLPITDANRHNLIYALKDTFNCDMQGYEISKVKFPIDRYNGKYMPREQVIRQIAKLDGSATQTDKSGFIHHLLEMQVTASVVEPFAIDITKEDNLTAGQLNELSLVLVNNEYYECRKVIGYITSEGRIDMANIKQFCKENSISWNTKENSSIDKIKKAQGIEHERT